MSPLLAHCCIAATAVAIGLTADKGRRWRRLVMTQMTLCSTGERRCLAIDFRALLTILWTSSGTRTPEKSYVS